MKRYKVINNPIYIFYHIYFSANQARLTSKVLKMNKNIFEILFEFPRFISACRRSFIAIEKSVPALMLENIA